MTSYKLYNTLLLSLSLTLTGCGSDNDDAEIPTETTAETVTETDNGTTPPEATPETTTPEGTLSLANPIADMTLIADTALNFSIPENTCVHTTGESINYSMSLANNAGFTLTNFTQLTGKPTELGVVTVTVTCSTTAATFTDEFTITVVDFEAAPAVEIDAPSFARANETFTLKAVAEDVNLSGSIVSYSWEVTTDETIVLIGNDTSTVSFTTPDTSVQTTATLEVTVTDNDGDTTTQAVTIDLISINAPEISLSFPFSLGTYNEDEIDMFGYAGFNDPHNPVTVTTVSLTVDDTPYTATVTDTTWRVKDVIITDTSKITILATASDGFINYEEVTLTNELYETTINNNIADIAVNESTDEVYVQVSGANPGDNQLTRFNLTSAVNSLFTVNQPDNYAYSDSAATSIALDSESDTLFVSYSNAISKIDLSTGNETILSDADIGTNHSTETPNLAIDLSYDSTSSYLYYANLSTVILDQKINYVITEDAQYPDQNGGLVTEVVGDRHWYLTVRKPTSIITYGDQIYFTYGYSNSDSGTIGAYTNGSTGLTKTLHTVESPANGGNGGAISDLTINGGGDELYFIDGSGDLVKLTLELSRNPPDYEEESAVTAVTTVVENLFSVESIADDTSPLIGLHYDTTRNVIIAAGRDADGTNKLLVIDPVSGDYAKVATGTVD
ncbi:hypothetical protein GCM10008107_19870 [Psychrosphaera saromensis]|uniref:Cadherin domain-containing protein n=1 Tax=Psychrosphaera saromensis TaxID=716813 RepID=A0A2S7USF1_9GAMM|nr:hypothetical protein [Psychrosphaera saromensis]PQJ52688.1 hypothetical protein BTO11_02820 [Psychrosphaera saromensis]GHB70480.1 hypothetical protein GCM10008107_19870 [Psychrosphaera saromensis]GLQ13172.1 hypothetical protein GCM10007917_06270 [Psychrosphaera saromensis]